MANRQATDMDTAQKEKILIPLRDLYKQDVKYRALIAKYANNFKKHGFFASDGGYGDYIWNLLE